PNCLQQPPSASPYNQSIAGSWKASMQTESLTAAESSPKASRPLHRILIVDDHAALRKGVRSFLESQGRWSVVAEAQTGHEALQAARDTQPDITILDYSLP